MPSGSVALVRGPELRAARHRGQVGGVRRSDQGSDHPMYRTDPGGRHPTPQDRVPARYLPRLTRVPQSTL